MPEPIKSFDENAIKDELRELVRRTMEDTPNGLLEEEADDLVGAERYERTAGRDAYRVDHYDRRLVTTSDEVTVRMPKLKGMRFTTAIIERHRRREASIEKAMIDMCLAESRRARSRTSAKHCGARACRPRPSPISTRRR